MCSIPPTCAGKNEFAVSVASVVWVISSGEVDDKREADRQRAATLGLPCQQTIPESGFYLQRDDQGLCLKKAEAPRTSGLRSALGDADEQQARLAGGRRSPLARALGLHRHPPLSVLDTTAGLGRDAMTLAALGCPVMALERQPALYALLDDATQRLTAQDQPPEWWSRWQGLAYANAGDWLARSKPANVFEAIYLDPMFISPRRKAAPQKALAWLAELAGADTDAAQLLATARQWAARRVVVKQHGRARPLAKPDHQIHGRAIRFDVYLA